MELLRHAKEQVVQSHAEMKLKMVKKGGNEMLADREAKILLLQ